jgi:hypothetical protein
MVATVIPVVSSHKPAIWSCNTKALANKPARAHRQRVKTPTA